jgi:hypothetical protein
MGIWISKTSKINFCISCEFIKSKPTPEKQQLLILILSICYVYCYNSSDNNYNISD